MLTKFSDYVYLDKKEIIGMSVDTAARLTIFFRNKTEMNFKFDSNAKAILSLEAFIKIMKSRG